MDPRDFNNNSFSNRNGYVGLNDGYGNLHPSPGYLVMSAPGSREFFAWPPSPFHHPVAPIQQEYAAPIYHNPAALIREGRGRKPKGSAQPFTFNPEARVFIPGANAHNARGYTTFMWVEKKKKAIKEEDAAAMELSEVDLKKFRNKKKHLAQKAKAKREKDERKRALSKAQGGGKQKDNDAEEE
jgi:hypothetical protein